MERIRAEIALLSSGPQGDAKDPESSSAGTMSSKRAIANRLNARHSTGPRTSAGKRWSSQNAFKHGLRSECLMLGSEDSQEHQGFLQTLRAGLAPRDNIEDRFVSNISIVLWKLRKCLKIEMDSFSLPIASRKQGVTLRYESSLERRLTELLVNFSRYRHSNREA